MCTEITEVHNITKYNVYNHNQMIKFTLQELSSFYIYIILYY